MKDLTKTAIVCHEVNRAYCKSLGDDTQLPWYEAPEWQRDSAINGVQAIVDGKVTAPEQSHENWLAAKKADGWKYGEVKNPETKEHPCMVPFNELPPEQQFKDHLFFAVVQAHIYADKAL